MLVAEYDGFAVAGYDKSGKSRHDLVELAGYCVFAVAGYGKIGKS